jgi:hypothetical protein
MRLGWTVLTGLLLTCATAHADQVQDDGSTLFARAFPTVTSLCADHLAEAAAHRPELETTAKENGIALAAATCRPSTRSLGVPFAGNAMYKRALFLEQSDGLVTDLRLVVETPRGLVPTTIGWPTIDPLDPGCPSTPETSGLAALRIENGYLVAVLRQTIITFDESGRGLTKAIHGATWCGEEAGALRCRTYESQYDAPLGRFEIATSGELVRRD